MKSGWVDEAALFWEEESLATWMSFVLCHLPLDLENRSWPVWFSCVAVALLILSSQASYLLPTFFFMPQVPEKQRNIWYPDSHFFFWSSELLFFSALSQKPSLPQAWAMLNYNLMQMVGGSSDSGQHIYSREKGKKMDLQIGRQVAGSLFHWQCWSTYFTGC